MPPLQGMPRKPRRRAIVRVTVRIFACLCHYIATSRPEQSSAAISASGNDGGVSLTCIGDPAPDLVQVTTVYGGRNANGQLAARAAGDLTNASVWRHHYTGD